MDSLKLFTRRYCAAGVPFRPAIFSRTLTFICDFKSMGTVRHEWRVTSEVAAFFAVSMNATCLITVKNVERVEVTWNKCDIFVQIN